MQIHSRPGDRANRPTSQCSGETASDGRNLIELCRPHRFATSAVTGDGELRREGVELGQHGFQTWRQISPGPYVLA
jgi:hypothetical protein